MLAILLLIVPTEITALFLSIRRSGFVPFPHILLAYLIGCQISIFAVADGVAQYSFLATYSSYAFKTHYYRSQIFFLLIFISSIALFSPPKDAQFLKKLQMSLRRTVNIPIGDQALWFAICTLWIYHLLLFLSLHWSLVWRNSTYLLMSNERVLSIVNPFTKLLIALLPVAGLLVFVVMGLFAWRKGRYVATALLPLAVFDLLYQLGAHSRKVVLYVALFSGLSYFLRRSKMTFVIGIVTALMALIFVLGGRQYGTHGISTIFSPSSVMSPFLSRSSSFAILNLFEGSFSTTELFNRSYSSPVSYKILSFSPLPSLIDGFDQIRSAGMHKLGRYTPPSAIFEASSFGAQYILLLFLPQVIAGRLVVRLGRKGHELLAVAANIMMAFATYMEFTYPIRSVYRFFLIALALALIGRYLESQQGKAGFIGTNGPDKDIVSHSGRPILTKRARQRNRRRMFQSTGRSSRPIPLR